MVCPQALSEMDEFKNLDNDIEGVCTSGGRSWWSRKPRKGGLPQGGRTKAALQKLCMVRCMRLTA